MASLITRLVRTGLLGALAVAWTLWQLAGAATAAAAEAPRATAAPATPLADLPPDMTDRYTGAALVDIGGGCSGVFIAPRPGVPPAAAPAYALTNGHCLDMLPPTAVRRDVHARGTVRFGWPGGDVAVVVAIRAIPWASMKTTDLAILELDATVAELMAQGIVAYEFEDTPAAAGTRIAIVGGPMPVDGAERQLLLAICTLGGTHRLVEDQWSWAGFPSNDCADIRPGSSGSPVLDLDTGRVVGLVNTGTAGSMDRSDCMLDRPCEVGPGARVASVEDTSYGPLVAGLGACFDARWVFTGPGGDCPLDPGLGLDVQDATRVTNPDVTPPTGRAPRTTWAARLTPTDPAITHYRAKTGPLGVVDCLDAEGYGSPRMLTDAPVFDDPLPRAEGRYQLCLLAGPGPIMDARWQEPRFATVVTAWVDRTPPIRAVRLHIDERSARWDVQPMIDAPELLLFRWKTGPAAATACADPAGYVVYRSAPRSLPFGDAPTRICVIGYDEAGNPTPTLDRVLAR